MKSIPVRNITLGEGIPKIIVPLVSKTDQELQEEIEIVMKMEPDMVEWRADNFGEVDNLEAVRATLSMLRKSLGETPLLFTFRTVEEGGNYPISVIYYEELLQDVIQTQLVDLIDLELFIGEDIVKRLVPIANRNGVLVVMSSHDFQKTPAKKELIGRLLKMQELGADIPKLAVMPKSEVDLITLLDTTQEMKKRYADRPIMTISMGPLGILSRLTGEVFGSAATFASGVNASAPGQIAIADMRRVLEILHQKEEK